MNRVQYHVNLIHLLTESVGWLQEVVRVEVKLSRLVEGLCTGALHPCFFPRTQRFVALLDEGRVLALSGVKVAWVSLDFSRGHTSILQEV